MSAIFRHIQDSNLIFLAVIIATTLSFSPPLALPAVNFPTRAQK
jgi:hypothetical protein